MKNLWRFLVVPFMFFGVACSHMETSGINDVHALLNNRRYQIKVRTGNDGMDAIIYEYAYRHFSKVLPVVEREPYSGSVEIMFGSEAAGYTVSSTNTNSNFTASAWYTGPNSVAAYGSGTTNGVTTTGSVRWQNATMIVVIRNGEGDRLGAETHKYEGVGKCPAFQSTQRKRPQTSVVSVWQKS